MKNHLKSLIMLLSLCLTTSVFAQSKITIKNDKDNQLPEGKIISEDFMTGDTKRWGKIDADGTASIKLPKNYMKKVLKEAKKQQKLYADDGWSLTFKTVNSFIKCKEFSEIDNDVVVENQEARIFGIPPFSVVEKSKKKEDAKSLFVTSNQAIASWLNSFRMETVAVGYYVEWIYVEKEASIKGSCSWSTATGQQNENFVSITTYDIEFDEGWNTIIHSIDEVFESKNGSSYPVKMTISTPDNLPDDAQVYLFEAK